MNPTVGAALTAVVSRASGLTGAAAPPRPRPPPPRPPRPPAAAAAAGAAAGAAGGGAAAASTGARSVSVDQRSSSMRNVCVGVRSPTTVARRLSAAESADISTPAYAVRTMPSVIAAALLPVIVVRSLGATEPLHEPLELVISQLGPALTHVDCHDAPPLERVARRVDPIQLVAGGARALQQRFAVAVGQESGGDFLDDVGAREGLGFRAKLADQPIQQDLAILSGQGDFEYLVLLVDEGVPAGAIQRVEGVVVDAMARRAVLEDDLPH